MTAYIRMMDVPEDVNLQTNLMEDLMSIADNVETFVGEGFVTKDSGERQEFKSGMVRDVTTGKRRWDLVASGPMMLRWADLLTRGAKKYDADNWMKASGQEEHDRFLESAYRHFMNWFYLRKFGIDLEPGEDHGAATFFNINGVEYVREKMGK